MFEKKIIPEANYDSMFGEEIVRSLERIEELSSDDKKIERDIELKELEWDSDVSNVKRELALMKGELGISKGKIIEIKARFTSIVNELRLSSSDDDFERLKKRIDEFDFEKFMRRDDFVKLISSR